MNAKSKISLKLMAFVPISAFGLAYLCHTAANLGGAYRRGDFSVFYESGCAMRMALNPYRLNLNRFGRTLGFEAVPFDHPGDTPALALFLEPLAFLPPRAAYLAWTAMSTGALMLFLWLVSGAVIEAERSWRLRLAFLALAFTPLAENIRWSQTQTFILLGLSVFAWLGKRGSDRAAGVLLAALGLLKIFPLAVGGYLLARKRWRAMASLLLALVVGGSLIVMLAGVPVIKGFAHVTFPLLTGGGWLSHDLRWALSPADVSMNTFVSRLFYLLWGASLAPGFALARRIVLIGGKLAILALTFRVTARHSLDEDRAFSLWIVTMLIISPVVWLHYLTLLLIPFAEIASAHVRGALRRSTAMATALSYCSIVLVTPLMSKITFSDWGPFSAVSELGFPSLLVAYAVCYMFATEARGYNIVTAGTGTQRAGELEFPV